MPAEIGQTRTRPNQSYARCSVRIDKLIADVVSDRVVTYNVECKRRCRCTREELANRRRAVDQGDGERASQGQAQRSGAVAFMLVWQHQRVKRAVVVHEPGGGVEKAKRVAC
eukprot:6172994-Pleurochrysis_carterae.AAC.1